MIYQKILLFVALTWLSPSSAFADIAPGEFDEETPAFDGSCACELICNAGTLKFYRIEFKTQRAQATTSSTEARKACEDEAKELRGLKSLKLDLTPRQATHHFCKFGGKDVAACSVDDACAEDKVECAAVGKQGDENQ